MVISVWKKNIIKPKCTHRCMISTKKKLVVMIIFNSPLMMKSVLFFYLLLDTGLCSLFVISVICEQQQQQKSGSFQICNSPHQSVVWVSVFVVYQHSSDVQVCLLCVPRNYFQACRCTVGWSCDMGTPWQHSACLQPQQQTFDQPHAT